MHEDIQTIRRVQELAQPHERIWYDLNRDWSVDDASRVILAARFQERSRDAWSALFDPLDACVSPVLELYELGDGGVPGFADMLCSEVPCSDVHKETAMPAVQQLRPVSVEDYLAMEETAKVRHELVDGLLLAMVGTSQRHNLITLALGSVLRERLRGTPCRVFMESLKVQVAHNFYYPDLVISCNPGEPSHTVVTDPRVIIEVLSTSTEARDRLEKRLAYQRLSSLQEYVLVSQWQPRVEVIRRTESGWELETATAEDSLRLLSLQLEIPLEALYEDLDDFPQGEEPS